MVVVAGKRSVFAGIFGAGDYGFLLKMTYFNGFTLSSKPHTATTVGAGFGGGLFQGIIGTGGPILTMYITAVIKQKHAVRATLIYLLFITSVLRLVVSIPSNLMTPRIIELALLALVPFLVAIMCGQMVHGTISERYYRFGIYVILAGSAVLLLSKALS